MEPSKRNELTDMLYAEVVQKLEALEKTLTAQGITSNGNPHTPQGGPPHDGAARFAGGACLVGEGAQGPCGCPRRNSRGRAI